MGPVEFLMISFPGNQFDGTIVPELQRLVDSETVHIIDLVFAIKDLDGEVSVYEFESLDGDASIAFAELDGEAGGLLNDDDVLEAAEALEPGSSGVFLVWEDVWAAPLADAIFGAGGEIIAGGRIPRAVMQEALDHADSES